MTQTDLPCSPDELRTLFLFEKLNEDQLEWLCQHGHVEHFEPGPVHREGDPATCFYILLDGTIVLSRRVGGDDVEINRTSNRGVYSGAFNAYLGDRVAQVYNNSVRAAEPSRFFVLDATDFAHFMQEWFPMAVHLLEGLFFGQRNTQQAVGQRERLLALGSLSAGLTHELNNPAAAAVRATSALRERVAGMRHKLGAMAAGRIDPATLQPLVQLQERAAELVSKAPTLSPIEASDREDAISDWLDDRGITDGWQLAPVFVQAGLDTAWLDNVAATVDEGSLDGALRWLGYTVETELLMNEIEDSTTRISTLVGAAKQYSQLDRAPYQVVNVHELLDSTLMMLGGKIPPEDHDRQGLRPRAAPDPGLRGRAEPGVDQPDRQRGVGDERLGHAHRAHRARPEPRPALRRVRRHRSRGARGHPGTDLRAVLHHQAGGRGHGARPRHLLADRGRTSTTATSGWSRLPATPASGCCSP